MHTLFPLFEHAAHACKHIPGALITTAFYFSNFTHEDSFVAGPSSHFPEGPEGQPPDYMS